MNKEPANGFKIITDHNLNLLKESREISKKAVEELRGRHGIESLSQVSVDESFDYITKYYDIWLSATKHGKSIVNNDGLFLDSLAAFSAGFAFKSIHEIFEKESEKKTEDALRNMTENRR
ncbi:hypothetical protein [Nitrosomonas marina]|uniref:Uncharacterized protein n=1 Tax=Nitrosomonas marina TaxID=917 RepID=A0A1H8GK76_9PROT|nr:hypothetical protein [Nitrosomonas marina]SEN44363.1 hypothetical protein SAMN05216325_11870 [Nitrosomonas marina]